MTEKTFTISDLKKEEKDQALKARVSTLAPIGDERRYHELDKGLSEYSIDLFGREDALTDLVKIGLAKKKDKQFRMLVLGAGTGKMADELTAKLGSPKNLHITELGLGDPRTEESKKFDIEHNIKFIDGDINNVKFDESSFDLVVSRMLMLHMVDPLRVIKKISSLMRKDGEFFADFRPQDFSVKFRETRTKTPEAQATTTIENARKKGALIFIDATGFYYKKNENRLMFDNLSYRKDQKGRIYYKLT